jgi:hypothetical protein
VPKHANPEKSAQIEYIIQRSQLFAQMLEPQYIITPRRCKMPADEGSAREIVGSSR